MSDRKSIWEWIGGAIGLLIVYLISRVNNTIFIIIFAWIAVTYVIFRITDKRVKTENNPMVFPFALQLAYYLVLGVSIILVAPNMYYILEPILFSLLIVRLIIKPSRGNVVFLTVLHSIVFATNILQVYVLLAAGVDPLETWKTLIDLAFHSLVKVLAIYTMFLGLKNMESKPDIETEQANVL